MINPVISKRLQLLYPKTHQEVYRDLSKLIQGFNKRNPSLKKKKLAFSEKDAILICYADHVGEKGKKTLPVLKKFLDRYVKGYFNKVHFLPFYPYTSDDGFSVVDYYKINPPYGDWKDVRRVNENFALMFDFVVNHISQKSTWFQEFLKGNPKYQDYFVSYEKQVDTSSVFRPRTHPLLTPFKTKKGTRYVWTTFSDDQVDINFANPEVMLEIVKALLFYIEQGAEIIRLDAIGYLWKKLGTSSLHLKETHIAVKLLRDVLSEVAPNVWIITETNVPHKDNISYFGDGTDEAHLVYNFTLPPLLLYTFLRKDSSALSKWAKTLEYPSDKTTFFNFTASHDGIGVTPLNGILPDDEIQKLAMVMEKRGGKINYRAVAGQKPVPYELNIVYLNAIGGSAPMIASQAIELSLKGVPAVYFNSFIGAENWTEGVQRLGYNRAINRKKFEYDELLQELENPFSTKNEIIRKFQHMLSVRTREPLFSPYAGQEIIPLDSSLFVARRFKGNKSLLSIVNVTDGKVKTPTDKIIKILGKKNAIDIIGQNTLDLTSSSISIDPYQVFWLK